MTQSGTLFNALDRARAKQQDFIWSAIMDKKHDMEIYPEDSDTSLPGLTIHALPGAPHYDTLLLTKEVVGQQLRYERISRRGDRKVRIQIFMEDYEPQAYGRVSYWTENGWTEIATFRKNNLLCRKQSPYAPEINWELFEEDAKQLLILAHQVL